MKIEKVLIVGGGIGGLTLALALRRARIPCAVFERAPELKEVGAGEESGRLPLQAVTEQLGAFAPVTS